MQLDFCGFTLHLFTVAATAHRHFSSSHSAHREYITGFRKRKQARRKDALSNLEKKQRQQRIEERAEVCEVCLFLKVGKKPENVVFTAILIFYLSFLQRRLAQKEQLNLAKYATDSDQEEEDNGVAKKPQIQVYNAGGLTSTVTVAQIKVGSDSEPEDNGNGGDSDDDSDALPEMPAAAQARKMEKAKQRARYREREEASRDAAVPTKLSKTSLRVMLKTKAKIAGKKTVGRKAAGFQPGKKGGADGERGGGGGKGGRKKGRR